MRQHDDSAAELSFMLFVAACSAAKHHSSIDI